MSLSAPRMAIASLLVVGSLCFVGGSIAYLAGPDTATIGAEVALLCGSLLFATGTAASCVCPLNPLRREQERPQPDDADALLVRALADDELSELSPLSTSEGGRGAEVGSPQASPLP